MADGEDYEHLTAQDTEKQDTERQRESPPLQPVLYQVDQEPSNKHQKATSL
jgi:hypothetical protein